MHNYMKRIPIARDNGVLDTGSGVRQIHIRHERACGIYNAESCDCDCQIVIELPTGDAFIDEDGSVTPRNRH